MMNLKNSALYSHSLNICDLRQLLDNEAFSKLSLRLRKWILKEATETYYNHSNSLINNNEYILSTY